MKIVICMLVVLKLTNKTLLELLKIDEKVLNEITFDNIRQYPQRLPYTFS